LLVPDHSGEGLPLHQARIRMIEFGLNLGVKIIALAFSAGCDWIEISERCRMLSMGEAQTEAGTRAGAHPCTEVHACFGAAQQRIHRGLVPVHKVLMKSVFAVTLRRSSVYPRNVGLVLAEQQVGMRFRIKVVSA
jgi:hypothetical protein